jgi:hypothetical protein
MDRGGGDWMNPDSFFLKQEAVQTRREIEMQKFSGGR